MSDLGCVPRLAASINSVRFQHTVRQIEMAEMGRLAERLLPTPYRSSVVSRNIPVSSHCAIVLLGSVLPLKGKAR